MLSGGNRDPSSRFTPRYTGCPRTVVAPFMHSLLDSAAAGVAQRSSAHRVHLPRWHPINSLIITFQKWLTSINIPFNPRAYVWRYVRRAVASAGFSRLGFAFLDRTPQRRCATTVAGRSRINSLLLLRLWKHDTRGSNVSWRERRAAAGIIRRRDRRER